MSFARFTFATAAFADTADALAENFNGIGGKALGEWLAGELRQRGFDVSEVYAEDHGWDFDVSDASGRYHCSASLEGEGADREGGVTIGKSRSLMDRLAGRNTLAGDDAVVACLGALLGAHPALEAMTCEFTR